MSSHVRLRIGSASDTVAVILPHFWQHATITFTRRAGDTVMIGNDVAVIVLETKSDRVRLGVIAPKSTRVDRTTSDPLYPVSNRYSLNRFMIAQGSVCSTFV